MRIPLPEGYQPPDSARPGEAFEVVATLKADGNGGFELVSIDGIAIEEEDEASKFAAKVRLPWNNA